MKNVIFDMDGVIFDTERLMQKFWLMAAEEYHLPGMAEIYPSFIGKNNAGIEEALVNKYGAQAPCREVVNRVVRLMRSHIREFGPPLKPYVKELLTFLKSNGYRVALASSTLTELVKAELATAQIDTYFDAILGGDMVQHGKPAPDIFLAACAALGALPEEAYVVEDSYNGIRSAYAAGAKPIMVPDILQPTPEIRQLCCQVLENLTELELFLKKQEE